MEEVWNAGLAWHELVSTVQIMSATVMTVAGVGLIVWMSIPRIRRRWMETAEEPAFREYLPFERMGEDGKTIECTGGVRTRVWRLEGLNHEAMTNKERSHLNEQRKAGMRSLGEIGIGLRFFTIRREVEAETQGRHGRVNEALKEIEQRWTKHASERLFQNEHYVAAYAEPVGKKQEDERSARLDKVGEALKRNWTAYKPKELNTETWPQTPMTAFAGIVGPLGFENPKVEAGEELEHHTGYDTVMFRDDQVVVFRRGPDRLYAGLIGVKALPRKWMEMHSIEIQKIRASAVVCHTVDPIGMGKALAELTREGRVAGETMEDGTGTYAQARQILQGTHPEEERAEAVNYSLIVMCHGRSEEELKESILEVERCLSAAGVTTRREGWGMQASFWHMLPSWPSAPRPWRMLTGWMGAIVVPQSAPKGIRQHDWAAGPITSFRSIEGSRFDFTFHPRADRGAPGHTIVIAETGSGKTHLTSHLAAQTLMLPDSRVFLMDRHNGAEIFVRAAGGTYVGLSAEDDASLNPFLMEDTPNNRRFLAEWMETLCGIDADAGEVRQLERAVRVAMNYLPSELRSVAQLRESAFAKDTRISEQLTMWSEGMYNNIFNAQTDRFAKWTSRLVGFDCTTAFDNPRVTPPLISYLMHRIREESRAKATPTMVYIDECEAMLRQPRFVEMFRQGMLEGRKLRQVYVCCFQRMGELGKLGVENLIRTQYQTAILLRNPKGDPDEYKWFSLTDPEMDFVLGKGRSSIEFGALVKRKSGESVIIETDLRPLGDYRRIYESGRDDVIKFRELTANWGESEGARRYIKGEKP